MTATNSISDDPLQIALIGLGTVGSGVGTILTQQADMIARRAGRRVVIRWVVVRDLEKHRNAVPAGAQITTDLNVVLNDSNLDLAVQLIGGTEPARQIMTDLLQAGLDVVTANKALLYEHGAELFQLAGQLGRTIAFEAAVAGGIPIIAALSQSLTANRILSIEAILNGTSNFILSEMLDNRRSYGEALADAQRRGYAEADPTMDVDGTDAAQKLALLTQLAFGTPVTLDNIIQEGIDQLNLVDLLYADELGYRVRLLATAADTDGELRLSVQPTLIRSDRPLARTTGAYNIVAIEGDQLGKAWFAGMGAGQLPTASAVVADIIDVACGRAAVTFSAIRREANRKPMPLLSPEKLMRRYYLRFDVDDRPHVLADIADALGRHQISIRSVIQKEDNQLPDGIARLVIMTHHTSESAYRTAATDLARLDCIHQPSICMPVANGSEA